MQVSVIELQRRIAQLVSEKEQLVKSIPKDVRAMQSAKDAQIKALQEQLQSICKEKQELQSQLETFRAQVGMQFLNAYAAVTGRKCTLFRV